MRLAEAKAIIALHEAERAMLDAAQEQPPPYASSKHYDAWIALRKIQDELR